MAELKQFRTDVRLAVPSVPDVVIDRAAFRAVRDFLTRSKVWTSELVNPMPYTPGARSYDPSPQVPVGSAPVAIHGVRWRPTGEEVEFLTKEQLTESFPGWETETDVAPEYWTLNSPIDVRLYPLASAQVPDAVEMTVTLTMADGYVAFPTWIYTKYGEEILPGVLSRIYSMADQDWTNPQLAGAHAASFEASIKKAYSAADTNFGRPKFEVAYGGI